MPCGSIRRQSPIHEEKPGSIVDRSKEAFSFVSLCINCRFQRARETLDRSYKSTHRRPTNDPGSDSWFEVLHRNDLEGVAQRATFNCSSCRQRNSQPARDEGQAKVRAQSLYAYSQRKMLLLEAALDRTSKAAAILVEDPGKWGKVLQRRGRRQIQ